jgi:hypothetical protein
MSYELSLSPDPDRGGHLYRAALTAEAGPQTIRELSAWLADAGVNPDARFELDLCAVGVLDPDARVALDELLARHAALLEERRLTVMQVAAPEPRVVRPTTLERAIVAVGPGAGL